MVRAKLTKKKCVCESTAFVWGEGEFDSSVICTLMDLQ